MEIVIEQQGVIVRTPVHIAIFAASIVADVTAVFLTKTFHKQLESADSERIISRNVFIIVSKSNKAVVFMEGCLVMAADRPLAGSL